MKFDFTPDEAQKTATAVIRSLKKLKMKVKIEGPLSAQAPYRTTIVAERQGRHVLVEAQGGLDYHRELRDLALWLAATRTYAELSVATSDDSTLQAGTLHDMKTDGVGLIVVRQDKTITIVQQPRNPALIVNPDPTLKYGHCKQEVLDSVQKFNNVNRKDGLRDMCELVERETEALAILAVRKNLLKMTEVNVKAMDWSSQINTLSSTNAYNPGHTPLVSAGLKDDLHSFTRGRNLVDHKVKSKRDDDKRQKQFAERMVQGPRLAAEIVALQRRVR